MPDKEHAVWQLTDGTVVIAGAKLPEDKLRAGEFEWIDETGAEQKVGSRIRYEVLRVLEKI